MVAELREPDEARQQRSGVCDGGGSALSQRLRRVGGRDEDRRRGKVHEDVDCIEGPGFYGFEGVFVGYLCNIDEMPQVGR